MKTALVTGASRGIGREIAIALGQSDFFVLFVDKILIVFIILH